MLTKQDIIEGLGRVRGDLSGVGVRSIGLFGSFVRGANREDSDIDFLVEFEEGKKNYDNFYEACCLLENVFHRKVEVVTPESLSPYIKPYVLNEVEYVPFAS